MQYTLIELKVILKMSKATYPEYTVSRFSISSAISWMLHNTSWFSKKQRIVKKIEPLKHDLKFVLQAPEEFGFALPTPEEDEYKIPEKKEREPLESYRMHYIPIVREREKELSLAPVQQKRKKSMNGDDGPKKLKIEQDSSIQHAPQGEQIDQYDSICQWLPLPAIQDQAYKIDKSKILGKLSHLWWQPSSEYICHHIL